MIRLRAGALAALVATTLTWLSAQERRPHVIMISIDGLRPALLGQSSLKLPTLRRLMQQGAWARVTGVLPTVTYPSHTTLITGVLPAVHGILDNRIFDPEGVSEQAWFWYSSAIKVTTLPGAVKARGLTAAGVSWPVTVGMALDLFGTGKTALKAGIGRFVSKVGSTTVAANAPQSMSTFVWKRTASSPKDTAGP